MFCKNCGNQMEEGIKFCRNCGSPVNQPEPAATAIPRMESEHGVQGKEYQLLGARRTGSRRLSFKKMPSDITIQNGMVKIKTQFAGSKVVENEFQKSEISEIAFKTKPVWMASDFVRLVVFGLLMFVTSGMAIFAVLFSLKIACCRHVVLTLSSGKKIWIPVVQDADAVPFLEEINCPLEEIQRVKAKKISEESWSRREWMITAALQILAAAAIAGGLGVEF